MKVSLVNGERIFHRISMSTVSRSDLSPRRAAFCRAYALGASPDNTIDPTIRFNGRKAALAAGYAPKQAVQMGWRLLGLDNIQREVQRLIDRVAQKQEVDAVEVLRRLDTVYARCMQAEAVIEDGSETGEYRFNAAGAIRACELIGRYLRMWQAEGSVNVNVTIDQARDFARGFARRILIAIEEHVADPDERKRLIGIIHAEAMRDE